MFHAHEKCKIYDFKFSKVMQQNTKGMVGYLIWKFTAPYNSERIILQIDQELTKL